MRSKTRSQKTSVAVASSSLDRRGSWERPPLRLAKTSAMPRKRDVNWFGGYSTGSFFDRMASIILRSSCLGVFMILFILENVKAHAPLTGSECRKQDEEELP